VDDGPWTTDDSDDASSLVLRLLSLVVSHLSLVEAMSGTITRLQFQQKTADRVNVYLDGQFAFGLPALDAARLRVGQHLSDADIDALHVIDQTQKAYDRAVRFLSYRPRSVAEVRRHLAQDIEDEATVEAVLGRLIEQGYLNDAEFGRYWVESRAQFRPKGPRALRQELRQRGLASGEIDAALSGLNSAEGAYTAARQRAARLADLAASDPAAFRRKLGDFLARRGFDYEIIRDVVARLVDEFGVAEHNDEL
jgi:regulatory protein